MNNTNDKLKNDCFRFTEKLLYSYKDIEEFIENTKDKLKDLSLEENVTTVGAINYDSIQVSPTFNINRIIENKVLDRLEDETDLNIELYKNQKIKREIDKAINNLSIIHKDVINNWYIKGMTWNEIVDVMPYEERQLRTKKKEAVKSIAIQLFGAKVFQEENETLFDLLKI